ncbi:hypothetical protein D0X99_19385 [Algoriphagus lacus]|uniref:UDP-glycosyltransferase n=1 Tax=Algoriphagus lacus TaxID=2056311 RepID=A0A418PM76_9BACT|nr:hypothetical protein [Algoriphagus lacus]RIW12247.1 hypothetical protein D0X99_19385 [Algoriphagus lacus]
MKICFLIPDGVGIRNYLYSDLLLILHQRGHEVVIWHALDQKVIELASKINRFTPHQATFTSYPEDFIIQLLRESTSYARLKHNQQITENPTIMLNWHEKKGSFKRKALIWFSEKIGKRIKGYQSLVATEGIYFARLRKTEAYQKYKSQLKEINPDVLFCTHQRYPGAAYALAAGEDLGVTTMTAIFSWDNLPKARLPIRAKFYTVWSNHMAEELKFYYPELKENQVLITGTPQFDFYKNEDSIISREDFAAQFGLDASKHWVCFSGCDSKTSPYDSDYLEDVANALKGQKDIQLIFRQVPVETVDRYQNVLNRHPEIIHLNPMWNKGTYWNQFFPYPEDIDHLVNLSYHCATVVNIGSTMALDFSWFDSPGLYLNYDHKEGQEWTVKDIYQFQHFRSMGNWDAVVWANSSSEILKKIRLIIDQPESVAKDRKLWLDKIIEPDLQVTASEKLAEAIISAKKAG